MKMKKRMLAVMLTAAIASASALPASAKNFSDVPRNSWARDGINYVSDNGIMNGTGNGQFSPDLAVTRAMMARIMYAKAGEPEVSTNSGFTDVPDDAWYAKAVAWAKANSIMNGVGDNQFAPNRTISRQDAVVTLSHYAQTEGYNTNKKLANIDDYYLDCDQIFDYAVDAVKWAIGNGIMSGTGSGKISPREVVTRAELATIITKYGANIEHVMFDKDSYSFSNSSYYFTNDRYYMTDAHYKMLKNAFARYYEGVQLDSELAYLQDTIYNREWEGSCYGMAATTILDKIGKIDLNGNYATNAATIHAINGKDIRGTDVESAINYYQWSQLLPCTMESKYSVGNLQDDLQNVIDDLSNTNGLALFCFFSEYGGHAIVAYDLTRDANGSYKISAYDNNQPNHPITITISSDKTSCTVEGYEAWDIYAVDVMADMNNFDLIDIDGASNNTLLYSGAKTNDLGKYTHFTASAGNSFTIKNAEGETLTWNGEKFTGSMRVVNARMIAANKAYVTFSVPNSEEYVYTNTSASQHMWINAVRENGYQRASGTNIARVDFNKGNSVTASGKNMTYAFATGSSRGLQTSEGTTSGSVSSN